MCRDQAAAAAAAADALGIDALGLAAAGDDLTAIEDVDPTSVARCAPVAAHGNADGGRLGLAFLGRALAEAHSEAARVAAAAAAAADALGHDPDRAVADRQQRSAVDHADKAAIAGLTPAAAHRDGIGAVLTGAERARGRRGDACVAAAAADALGVDDVGKGTEGGDLSAVGHIDPAPVISRAAEATHGNSDVLGFGSEADRAGAAGQIVRPVVLVDAGHAAMPAAAADALGEYPVGGLTVGDDLPAVVDGDRAADRAGPAEPADVHGQVDGFAARHGQRACRTPGATAAADTLGEEGSGPGALGNHETRRGDRHVARRATGAARTAQGHREVDRFGPAEGRRKGHPARPAAAADALGEHGVGIGACGADVAGVGY